MLKDTLDVPQMPITEVKTSVPAPVSPQSQTQYTDSIAQPAQIGSPKNFPKWLIVVLGISFLVVIPLIGVSLVVTTVYTGFRPPLVSNNTRNSMLLALYKVPLIPKTPEQILLAAMRKEAALSTYTTDFSISARLGGTAIDAGSLDLHITGPVHFSETTSEFDVSIDAGVNVAGTLYHGKGTIRKSGEKVYGMLVYISDSIIKLVTTYTSILYGEDAQGDITEIRSNLNTVLGKWVEYDTKGIESEARKNIAKLNQEQSLVDSTRKNTQEFLLREAVLPEVKKMADETIEGIPSFHLTFVPSKETLQKIFTELNKDSKQLIFSPENITRGVDTVEMDVWFGKKDAILRKFSIRTQLNLYSFSESLRKGLGGTGFSLDSPLDSLSSVGDQKLTISTVLSIKDVGKEVAVTTPDNALSLEAYGSELMNALKTEKQKAYTLELERNKSRLTEISQALLKYYVDKGVYPVRITDLLSRYLTIETDTGKSLSDFSYRRKSDGKAYVLYLEFSSASSYTESTPYYGVTSKNAYPRQLLQQDFDIL